jgi:SPP1 family predicted phage head-tail adaptor
MMVTFPTIGELSCRITLQKPLKTEDEGGGKRVSWQDVVDVWASVEPISSREYLFAQQNAVEVTHRIKIRYRDDVKNTWRIRCGEDHYRVGTIIDIGGGGRFLEILAQEYPENE